MKVKLTLLQYHYRWLH